jgi:hypothetical protein
MIITDPNKTYYGGSEGGLQNSRDQMEAGRLQGFADSQMGIAYAQGGASYADPNYNKLRDKGYEQLQKSGNQIAEGQSILWDSAQNMNAAANTNAASVAEAHQRLANDQNSRQMIAQASSARGGNQAAAMRGAQAAASSNALQTNQQIGVMRAQEEQAKIGRQMQAAQYMGGVGTTNMNFGIGQQAQGLATAFHAMDTQGDRAIQQGQIGVGMANAANNQQSIYTSALTDVNKSQLNADLEYERQRQEASNARVALAGDMVGGAAQGIGMMAGV